MNGQTSSFEVHGMSCAACVDKVEKAILKTPGVTDVAVSLGTGTARIQGFAGILDKGPVLATVRELGYEASEKLDGRAQLDREQELRTKELRTQKRNMWFAWPLALAIMLGTFQEYWIFPRFVPAFLGTNLVLMLLTLTIVLGPVASSS